MRTHPPEKPAESARTPAAGANSARGDGLSPVWCWHAHRSRTITTMHRIAIVVADADRARIFTCEAGADANGAAPLHEHVDLVDPERRLHSSQVRCAVEDYREAHAHEID